MYQNKGICKNWVSSGDDNNDIADGEFRFVAEFIVMAHSSVGLTILINGYFETNAMAVNVLAYVIWTRWHWIAQA